MLPYCICVFELINLAVSVSFCFFSNSAACCSNRYFILKKIQTNKISGKLHVISLERTRQSRLRSAQTYLADWKRRLTRFVCIVSNIVVELSSGFVVSHGIDNRGTFLADV